MGCVIFKGKPGRRAISVPAFVDPSAANKKISRNLRERCRFFGGSFVLPMKDGARFERVGRFGACQPEFCST
jgi:hypothetical protein